MDVTARYIRADEVEPSASGVGSSPDGRTESQGGSARFESGQRGGRSLFPMMQSPDPGLAVAERDVARFLGVEFWLGDGGPDGERLERLVADGLENGFLTYDEIANALEDVELTIEQSEEIYAFLLERSIELVEGERHKHPPPEQPQPEEEQVA